MARAQAVCGRSIYRLSGRAQKSEHGRVSALFCGSVDRATVGIGPWWNSSFQIPTLEIILVRRGHFEAKKLGRKKAAQSCWSPLRSGSLRSPPLCGLQHEALPASLIVGRKNTSMCYPCVCSKCYPCVCPLPTPALSRGRGRIVFSRSCEIAFLGDRESQ